MGYLITLLLGVACLLGSLYLLNASMEFIKTGNRTSATVNELRPERGKKGRYTYRPIFKFVTITGKEIKYAYSVASSPPDWAVGDKATLIYQTNDPENALVLTYFGAFQWAIILLAIAAPLLIIGGGYFVFGLYAKQFLV
ncbi:hypothetical protein GCM10028818_12980 [Spirosoma horti]